MPFVVDYDKESAPHSEIASEDMEEEEEERDSIANDGRVLSYTPAT